MAVANSAMIRTGGIASRVFAGVGIAVGSMALLSIREAGNFEQSLNVLQAVSHATAAQLGLLQAKAIALGGDLKLPGVTAKDAALAMTQLAKGGLSVNQVLAASKGTLQLAVAAQISFTDAADMTTRALKMFGLEANQSSRVSNVLAAGANASTASIADMAYGLQNAGMAAHKLHIPIEETVGSIAMLVDAGLSGERAGTSFSTMLYRLASPSDKAKAALEKLHITAFTASGAFRGLQPVIRDFAAATKDMGDQQQLAMLKLVFGMRANQGMIGLLRDGGNAQKEYTKSVTGTNAAQDIAVARMKGFNGMMEKVSNAVSTLAVELGLKMLPWLTKTGTALAQWVGTIDVGKIARIAVEIGTPIVTAFQNLFNFIRSNADWLLPLVAGVYSAIKVFSALTLAAKAFSTIQMAGGMAAMLGPIGLIAIAVGALVIHLSSLGPAFAQSGGGVAQLQSAFIGLAPVAHALVSALQTLFAIVASGPGSGFIIAAASATALYMIISRLPAAIAAVRSAMETMALTGMSLNPVLAGIAIAVGIVGAAWMSEAASSRASAAATQQQVAALGAFVSAAAAARGASLNLEQAHVTMKQAVLEVKSAIAAKSVLEQAGKTHSLAYEEATVRVTQAFVTRKRATDDLNKASAADVVQSKVQKTAAVDLESGMAKLHAKFLHVQDALKASKPLTDAYIGSMKDIASHAAAVERANAKAHPEIAKVAQATKIAALANVALAQELGKIPDVVTKVSQGAKAAALGVGTGIKGGVIAGTAGLGGELGAKLAGEVMAAIAQAKAAAKIQSPSQVTHDQIGVPLGQGIILGFLNGTRDLPSKISDRVKAALEAGKRAIDEARSKFESGFSALASASMSAFDRQMSKYKTPAEKALEAMDLEDRVKRINDAVTKAQADLAKAMSTDLDAAGQEKLNNLLREQADAVVDLGTKRQKLSELEAAGVSQSSSQWMAASSSVREAEQKVTDYQNSIDKLKATAANPEAIAAAQDALDSALRDKKRFGLEQEATKEREAFDAKTELRRYQFEKALTQLEEHLAKTGASHEKSHAAIMALYKKFGLDYRNAGGEIGKALAAGILDALKVVEAAAVEIAAVIKKHLKTGSPTEEGPMSDLNTWWDTLAETLVSGIKMKTFTNAITDALAISPSGLAGGAALGVASSPAPAPVTNVFNIEGTLVHERDLIDHIYTGLQDRERHTTSLWRA